jgi:hypothetical protein
VNFAPLVSLVLLGIVLGIALLWVVRRVSNQAAIRDAKRGLQAHLYELRLFADEPKLIWRAQVGLLRQNLRYLALMLFPAVVLTLPSLALFVCLDAFYGLSPLAPGRPALITVKMNQPLPAAGDALTLELPDGIRAESPPVRVMRESEISWRIRPLRLVSGHLKVEVAGESAAKSIRSGAGPAYLVRRRVSSVLDLLRNPGERPLSSQTIDWIEVDYPRTEIECLGLRLHWAWWLLLVSMATAFLLRGRFRVTF